MKDLIIIAVVAVLLTGALVSIYRAKRAGKRCIGCPDGCSCKGACGSKVQKADQQQSSKNPPPVA